MTIDKFFKLFFATEKRLKLLFEVVYTFAGHSEIVHDVFSIPFVSSFFFLIFKGKFLLPCFLKLFFFFEVFEGHGNWVFWLDAKRIGDLLIVDEKLLKAIDELCDPLWLFRFEVDRI